MTDTELIPLTVLAIILSIGAACDLRFQRIPNWLTLPAALLSLAYHTVMNGFSGLLFSLEGVGVGIAILLPFYLLGGMGAGDCKLLGAVGGFLGPQGVFMAFLFTAVVGGVYALVLLAASGYLRKTLLRLKSTFATLIFTRNFVYIPAPATEKKPRLFYGLAISLGTMLSVGLGSQILSFN